MDPIGSVALLITAAFAAYKLKQWWSDPGTEAGRRLAREPKLTIAQLKPGLRGKVIGAASPLGPLMKSPVGERECIGFRLIIRAGNDSGFAKVLAQEACDPFVVSD